MSHLGVVNTPYAGSLFVFFELRGHLVNFLRRNDLHLFAFLLPVLNDLVLVVYDLLEVIQLRVLRHEMRFIGRKLISKLHDLLR